MAAKAEWSVLVGNIGTTYRGTDGFAAHRDFQIYCGQSRQMFGRAAGEPVTLFKDGEISKEYSPIERPE